jgi:hypothetical protein
LLDHPQPQPPLEPVQFASECLKVWQVRAILPHAARLLKQRATMRLSELLNELSYCFTKQLVLGLARLLRDRAKDCALLFGKGDSSIRDFRWEPEVMSTSV